MAAIENAKFGLAFASGLAAEQAIIQTLKTPCEVVVSDDVYGGTGRLFRKLFSQYGIHFHFVDMTDLQQVRDVMTSHTKLLWAETPTNPTLKVLDIEALADIAHQNGSKLVVDNTFASPIFQQPLSLGADLVVHSTTKYIGGHSDMIGGAIVTNDTELQEQLKFIQFAAGAVPGPFECFLQLRSIKTLAIRMRQHESNAKEVAAFEAETIKEETEIKSGISQINTVALSS